MKVVTLAAGMAVGYVLGTRAGREKYQQIVAGARKVSSHPTVVQAQNKAKDLIGTGADMATAKLAPKHDAYPQTTTPQTTTSTAVPRSPRQPGTPVNGVITAPPLA